MELYPSLFILNKNIASQVEFWLLRFLISQLYVYFRSIRSGTVVHSFKAEQLVHIHADAT